MKYRLKEICIEVTKNCPNNCIHCSSRADTAFSSNSEELTLNEIKSIIDNFCEMNRPRINADKTFSSEEIAWLTYKISQLPPEERELPIYKKLKEEELLKLRKLEEDKPVVELSGGEPLIRKDIVEIIQYIKKKGLKLLIFTSGFTRTSNNEIVGLAANSDLLDKLSKTLKEEDGDCIILSLEGAKEKTHDYITQHSGSFKIVEDAIIALKNHKINVELNCTPMRLNYREIPELIEIATNEYKIKNISFLRLVPQGRAQENKDNIMLNPEEFKELIEILHNKWLEALKEPSRPTKIRLGCPIDFRHLMYPVKRKPCHGGRDQILIRPNGDIHPCPAWKEINHMSLGNIKKISLQHAWLNSEILDLFRSYSASNLWGDCYYCPNGTDICAGGCPAQRIIANMERGIKNKEAQLRVGPDPLCFKHLL